MSIESIEHLRRELKREQTRSSNLSFDSLSGSVGDDAGAAPLFLRKTFKMIDSCPPNLGGWSAAGDTFLVRDPDAFSSLAIPQYFRHSNFSSFVRQLNFYGFRKVKTDKHGLQRRGRAGEVNKVWEFRHPLFKRGQPALLNEMRKKGDFVDSVEVAALRGQIITLRSRCDTMTDSIERLCSTVETLVRRVDAAEAKAAAAEAKCAAVTAAAAAAEQKAPQASNPRKRRSPASATAKKTGATAAKVAASDAIAAVKSEPRNDDILDPRSAFKRQRVPAAAMAAPSVLAYTEVPTFSGAPAAPVPAADTSLFLMDVPVNDDMKLLEDVASLFGEPCATAG